MPPSFRLPLPRISLRHVCLGGLFLVFLLCGGLILISLYSGVSLFPSQGIAAREDTFYRDLREYDALLAQSRENPERLSGLLDRLEKKALGVESHLAVLKRRRALAQENSRFLPVYQRAARRAAKIFPYSQPLAAVALEALLRENTGFSGEQAAELRNYAGRISDARLMPLVLAWHILSGAMQDPASALSLPNLEALADLALPSLSEGSAPGENLGLILNLMIMRVLEGDIAGVQSRIDDLLRLPPGGERADPKMLRFAAEFFFDYGNPRRAAELFARFSDPESLARQGDALWYADLPDGARNIWTVLTAPQGQDQDGIPPEIRTRSLYNLAAVAPDKSEEAAYLTRLLAEGRQQEEAGASGETLPGGRQTGAETSYIYGIIRYTRLLDKFRAQTILEEGGLRNHPLLDLELLRRLGEAWPVDRSVAETWLLLGRHPEDERLYQWGAYFFDYQRHYEETAEILKNAGYHNMGKPWIKFHEALGMIRQGQLAKGEEALEAIPPSAGYWQVPANIGRIQEARRSIAAALEHYETAAALVKHGKAAARLQVRIAKCLQALGRDRESRRILEYALDLDEENLNARLELRHLDSRGIY